ncbi:MAG: FAD-dependent oxidoreductase [Betaproteobacteria bacterium]|nr:FAD-dependent oxidoreductase [Betaproteobacteria bacterium]
MSSSQTLNSHQIAVIGGGYAGMAAAVRLAERGLPSVVFEAGPVLGGRARRIQYRDATLDNGQHILSGAYASLLGQMRQVGVPPGALRRIPLSLEFPPAFSLCAPKLPAPLHLAWALLTAKGLTWPARRAAIRFMQALKAARFQVNASWTVDQLLIAHRQPATVVEWLWRPLTVSALNTPTDLASAQVFVNVLRDALASNREASDLLLPMTDLSALFPEPAAAWLAGRGGQVHTSARITRLQPGADHVALCRDGVDQMFSRVVVAVGPQQIDALGCPGLTSPAFQYQPIYTVYLQYPGDVTLPYAMTGRTQGLTQWFFDRARLSATGRARGLVAAVISAQGGHEELDHADLSARVHTELTALAGPLPAPSWQKVIAERFATFSCTPGLARPATTTGLRHCFLAGDYVAGDYPATLESAVQSGILAADQVAASLSMTDR